MLSYCYRYSTLLRLAEGRLETLAASTKDAEKPPTAEAPAVCLGHEVREQVGCVGLEPAQSVSNVEKPEKLLGEQMNEQIESVILEAAHNACKSACTEGKIMGEGKSCIEGKSSAEGKSCSEEGKSSDEGKSLAEGKICTAGKTCTEGKSSAEGSGEQDCGVLEAKVRLCHKSDSQKDWIELT